MTKKLLVPVLLLTCVASQAHAAQAPKPKDVCEEAVIRNNEALKLLEKVYTQQKSLQEHTQSTAAAWGRFQACAAATAGFGFNIYKILAQDGLVTAIKPNDTSKPAGPENAHPAFQAYNRYQLGLFVISLAGTVVSYFQSRAAAPELSSDCATPEAALKKLTTPAPAPAKPNDKNTTTKPVTRPT